MRRSRSSSALGVRNIGSVFLFAICLILPAIGAENPRGPGLTFAASDHVEGKMGAGTSSSTHRTVAASQGAPYALALIQYGNEISWPESTDSCFSYYGVSYFDPTSGTWYGPESFSGVSNTVDLATTDFEPGVTYEWEVQDNDCGNTIGGTSFANITQPTPYAVDCHAVNASSVSCSWNDDELYGGLIGFYEYQLTYFPTSCGIYCGNQEYAGNFTNIEQTSFTLNGLAPGSSYYFELAIVDECTGPLPSSYAGGCDTSGPGGPTYGTIYDGYARTTTSTIDASSAGRNILDSADEIVVLVAIIAAGLLVTLLLVLRRREAASSTRAPSYRSDGPPQGFEKGVMIASSSGSSQTDEREPVKSPGELENLGSRVPALPPETSGAVGATQFGLFCPFCGYRTTSQHRFCRKCGRLLPAE